MESSRSSEFGMYMIMTTTTTFWLYLMLRLNFLQGGSFLHCVTDWCCRAKHCSTHSFSVYYTLLHWLWVDLLFSSIRSRKYSQRACSREIVPVEGWIKELPYSTHNQEMDVLLYWCLLGRWMDIKLVMHRMIAFTLDSGKSRNSGHMKSSTPRTHSLGTSSGSRPKSMMSSISGSRAQYSNSTDQELSVQMTEFGLRRVKKMDDGAYGMHD